jgi:hypothetical protein
MHICICPSSTQWPKNPFLEKTLQCTLPYPASERLCTWIRLKYFGRFARGLAQKLQAPAVGNRCASSTEFLTNCFTKAMHPAQRTWGSSCTSRYAATAAAHTLHPPASPRMCWPRALWTQYVGSTARPTKAHHAVCPMILKRENGKAQ